MRRHLARELAFQVLFSLDQRGANLQEWRDALSKLLENFRRQELPELPDREFANRLLTETAKYSVEIDEFIASGSENWKVYRLSFVDRSLLRLGVLELVYFLDVPARSAIDEYVELSKRFGTEDSSSFINGVLDGVAKKQKREM
jgi:transcription antitermination protein NusB